MANTAKRVTGSGVVYDPAVDGMGLRYIKTIVVGAATNAIVHVRRGILITSPILYTVRCPAGSTTSITNLDSSSDGGIYAEFNAGTGEVMVEFGPPDEV